MQQPTTIQRITSIDTLRGLVIVIMGLDHVRDFFSSTQFDPMNPTETTPLWFFTRWVTHYCAPTFVFLAGVSAFIYGTRVDKKTLSKFLLTRGLWLIFIEFTFVHFGWTFDFSFFFVQVIWVIGWSMIILGLLVYLPPMAIAIFTALLILGHNALDSIQTDQYFWKVLHQQYFGPPVSVVYPLIPWPAVMTLGYLVGQLYLLESSRRKTYLILSGTLIIIFFLFLRFLNGYGDSNHWQCQSRGVLYSLFDILDTTKYPPSLLYLCMTLGPSVIILGLLENRKCKASAFFQTFGRVPFFYYILHIYVIHLSALTYNGIRYGEWRTWLFGGAPENYTPSLIRCYVAWIFITMVMFLLCRWFNGIKNRHNYWWLKYL